MKKIIQLSAGNFMEITSMTSNSTRASNDANSFLIKEFANNESTHMVKGTYCGVQFLADLSHMFMHIDKLLNVFFTLN